MGVVTATAFERLERCLTAEQLKQEKGEPSGYSADPVGTIDTLDVYRLELADGTVMLAAFRGKELHWFQTDVPNFGAVRITRESNTENWGVTAGRFVDNLLETNSL